ncbi:MAG: hypothetical protein ABW194_04470 [Novosphingobium sp.]
MPRALKVFRTAIGFHDAYVAASSRKAALAAWGTDKDLFARGAAEEVTDPALTAAPLAHPGEVIRSLRGGAAENLAALGKAPKRTRRAAKEHTAPSAPAPPPPPPPPRPSREGVDKAEKAIERLRAKQEAARAQLARRRAELEREEADLRRAQREELEPLEAALSEAQDEHDHALRAWRDSL